MDICNAANRTVLEYYGKSRPNIPILMAREEHPDPYLSAGCHPEIVERLWDQIGPALPSDCRCLVYGTPALVVPPSGIILAIGMGTQYGLRLPGAPGQMALEAGARTTTTWGVNRVMDIQESLGPDWLFGCWKSDELVWCNQAYDALKAAT